MKAVGIKVPWLSWWEIFRDSINSKRDQINTEFLFPLSPGPVQMRGKHQSKFFQQTITEWVMPIKSKRSHLKGLSYWVISGEVILWSKSLALLNQALAITDNGLLNPACQTTKGRIISMKCSSMVLGMISRQIRYLQRYHRKPVWSSGTKRIITWSVSPR